jgi:hypothetical protein
MIAGAPRGWSQTLDRLEQEVARIQKAAPGGRAA